MNRVGEKLDAVEREKADRAYRGRRCKMFLRAISCLSQVDADGTAPERQVNPFLTLANKLVVGDGLTFILRDGMEW